MWSQIQRKLYEIIDPKINLQVHCAVYPGGGKGGAFAGVLGNIRKRDLDKITFFLQMKAVSG